MSKLQVLSLNGNQISGSIPSSLYKCKELRYLSLWNNSMEGSIPIEIGNLTMLQSLFLGYNNFKGTIPSVIKNIISLEMIDFSVNNFTGQIPSSLCNLSSLMALDLSNNRLDGTIQECVGNLSSSLFYLDLRMNNFHVEGSLPRSLGNCKDLKLLDVGNNYLNDTFPNWLGILDQLQVLDLRSNRFYGKVDSSDVTFTRLRVIDLSRNNFSGYLPVNFFKNLHAIREENEKKAKPEYMEDVIPGGTINIAPGLFFTTKGLETEFEKLLTIWTAIDFSSNQFSGEIPKTIGELHSLIALNLSHNCLTGPIPSSLGDLSELESLDLSSNKLHGRIPTEFTNLGFLEVLNLSHNNLVGPIPHGKQLDTFSNDSYIGNLGLCGLPLSKSCDNDEGTPAKFDRDDDEDGLNWKFSILMGYGCGLVLGLSMGYIVFTTGRPWWFIKIYVRVQQRFAEKVKNRTL
ncbi:Signal transduction histidine kinase, hybrid-type, ethylene sensor isoform 1 [Hibiscus syriacus]|uniref:Signal transduction histidine kinase, hybrid-type, ethylene sensor isoform 1 n=1 Tax=Hibiscus syriacus TaxID=106335 RepID=A0A6A3C922_HIBSY|nr:Signal transduction histidine kinase, hybrid-type, ethylene sensor isoform 1 [Hibiscus syriacus]